MRRGIHKPQYVEAERLAIEGGNESVGAGRMQ
jgi:hypothetical protein